MLSRLKLAIVAMMLLGVFHPRGLAAQECGKCLEGTVFNAFTTTATKYHCFGHTSAYCYWGGEEEDIENVMSMGQWSCNAETEDPEECHAQWMEGSCLGEHFQCFSLVNAVVTDLELAGSGITTDATRYLVDQCGDQEFKVVSNHRQ